MNYFLIYIAGLFISYMLIKFYSKIIDGDYWSKSMRLKAIGLSFFSWFCVIITTITFIREYNNDDDASW